MCLFKGRGGYGERLAYTQRETEMPVGHVVSLLFILRSVCLFYSVVDFYVMYTLETSTSITQTQLIPTPNFSSADSQTDIDNSDFFFSYKP
jgi:hypothetical protein